MKNKCQYIEVCRFIGAIIILCHHSYTLMERTFFLGGWAFVEFYFMLTGYYTTEHFLKHSEKVGAEYRDIFYYIKNKIKKIYPYAVGGVLLDFIRVFVCTSGKDEKILSVFSLIYNLSLLKGVGIANASYVYDPPLWYVTYLLLFLPLLIILMTKVEKIYKYFLCWFVPIMFFSLDMIYMNKIAIWEGGIFQVLRGTADLIMGSALFFVINYYKRDNNIPQKTVRMLSTVGFLGFVWITVFFRNGGVDISAEILGYLFIVMVLILLNDRNYIDNHFVYSICSHMGKLSLPIYCLHFPIQGWIQLLMPSEK